MFIAAYDVESPQSFLIELSDVKARDILYKFNNDLEKLSKCLKIMNNKLILLNPVLLLVIKFSLEISPQLKLEA